MLISRETLTFACFFLLNVLLYNCPMIGGDILTIGDRIRALRKAKGLTQKELAQKLGVSASMVGQYETNVRKPKPDTLARFAEALGLNLTEYDDIYCFFSPSLFRAESILQNISKDSSEDEKKAIHDEIFKLIGNAEEEIEDSKSYQTILRREYISYFDRLNFYGKCLAIKEVKDLANKPELLEIPSTK